MFLCEVRVCRFIMSLSYSYLSWMRVFACTLFMYVRTLFSLYIVDFGKDLSYARSVNAGASP